MPVDQLDYMVSMIQRDYNLHLVVGVTKGTGFYPLSVPSEGTFIVSVRDHGCMSGFSLGVGLPLAPRCALVAIPVENKGAIDLSLLPSSLANYSVGISPSRRVVLHPGVRQSIPEDQLRNDLKELRQTNDVLWSSIRDPRQKMTEGFGLVGIVPPKDRIGRIVPPER
jgi:hypothetical protein